MAGGSRAWRSVRKKHLSSFTVLLPRVTGKKQPGGHTSTAGVPAYSSPGESLYINPRALGTLTQEDTKLSPWLCFPDLRIQETVGSQGTVCPLQHESGRNSPLLQRCDDDDRKRFVFTVETSTALSDVEPKYSRGDLPNTSRAKVSEALPTVSLPSSITCQLPGRRAGHT